MDASLIRRIEIFIMARAGAVGRTWGTCVPVLISALGLALPYRAIGQGLTILHSFDNDNGSAPLAGLIVSDNTLYGTTFQGGMFAFDGVVFAINTDGTGFTNLYSFNGSDGYLPNGLTLSGDRLYVVTGDGGDFGSGNVFSANTDGSGSTNLYSFAAFPQQPPHINPTGSIPDGAVVVSGEMLYGTAEGAGTLGFGTVFALSTNGTGFKNLHNFNGSTNDGAFPSAGLLLSGNVLYGTTEGNCPALGNDSGNGTVFRITADGSIFTTLHVFSGSDGSWPESQLVLSGNTLYGTTATNGILGKGSVFSLNTNGFGFANLHNFAGRDGDGPSGSLVLRGDTLYGTTQYGGSSGNGTIFAVKTDGTGFTNLYSFTAPIGSSFNPTNTDGANPAGGLTLSGNVLYGTAQGGGTLGYGTVFSLLLPPLLPPSLAISPLGRNVVLTWSAPANAVVEQIADLKTTNWMGVTNTPTLTNGLYQLVLPVTSGNMFYRLKGS